MKDLRRECLTTEMRLLDAEAKGLHRQLAYVNARQAKLRARQRVICLQVGHTYGRASTCVTGQGHCWNCEHCGHGAPGRHLSQPDPWTGMP